MERACRSLEHGEAGAPCFRDGATGEPLGGPDQVDGHGGDLTNPLIFGDAQVAVIWVACVVASAHVGLERGNGQGGAFARAA